MKKHLESVFLFYILFATNKLRLSAYNSTPSGNPKQILGSVCPFQTFFLIPWDIKNTRTAKRRKLIKMPGHTKTPKQKSSVFFIFLLPGRRKNCFTTLKASRSVSGGLSAGALCVRQATSLECCGQFLPFYHIFSLSFNPE